ncbi:MAG: NAD(P)/FAD-dependent oxidoreductase [Candidatus Binataceae bacterium]|nr:NAD(P)/FAD-dependent oxidoreductase [Candidatus Binataceae bacterium]
MDQHPQKPKGNGAVEHYDAVVIGAGFGGLYALHYLREMGLSVRVYDGAAGVGGTWWWNRYPGARVDFPGGPFYCYTFSEELVQEWDWAETQPDQPAVLAYLDYVADRFNLRRDIQLETWVHDACYDEDRQRWMIETSAGARVSTQFLICAVGTLSAAYKPDIPGIDDFAGESYHSGRWPHKPVSFAGKRVGVIGTGSSGVQAIPEIASEAAHLTVFQRTPQYTIPARNRPIDPEVIRQARENWAAIRAKMNASPSGSLFEVSDRSALDDLPEQRQKLFEELWQKGGLHLLFGSYADIVTDKDANRTLANFLEGKIRQIVRDPKIAEKLMPNYYVGTKRQILDNGYYETFNRENVALVDLREDPILKITPAGVCTERGEHPLDMLVLATGFDAISGALLRLNPKGRGGISLKEKWSKRFDTYLGLAIADFPNLFLIHGPGSPSVLFNMPLGAELESAWIGDCVRYLREHGLGAIEPTSDAEKSWDQEVAEIANRTLFPLTDSWYTGANIPGKPRQFCVHLAGPRYFQRISEIAASDYKGFVLEKKIPATD